MHGHVLLFFNPERVFSKPVDIPAPDDGDNYSHDGREAMTALLRGTPLECFTFMNNCSRDGWMYMRDGSFIARDQLQIDPRSGKLTAESRPYANQPQTVNLFVWVSVDRSRTEHLACGTWHDEKQKVGVQITNDPAAADPSRMHIVVVAPSLAKARDAFHGILTGEIRPQKPWII